MPRDACFSPPSLLLQAAGPGWCSQMTPRSPRRPSARPTLHAGGRPPLGPPWTLSTRCAPPPAGSRPSSVSRGGWPASWGMQGGARSGRLSGAGRWGGQRQQRGQLICTPWQQLPNSCTVAIKPASPHPSTLWGPPPVPMQLRTATGRCARCCRTSTRRCVVLALRKKGPGTRGGDVAGSAQGAYVFRDA